MILGYLIIKWSSPYLDETIASIPSDGKVLVIDNKEHRWPLAKAWNLGIDQLLGEGCDTVTVCNDDIVLRPDTAKLNTGILLDRQDLLIVSGNHTDRAIENPEPILRDHCDFSCFTMNHRLFKKAGRFDENFAPAFFEDGDCHRRIRLAGYEAKAYAPFFHYLNGTIKHDAERRLMVEATFPGLHAYYVRKWGGEPGHEIYTQPFDGGPMMPPPLGPP